MTDNLLALIEAALDSGRLYANVNARHPWRVRRNGKTKTWKTRPGEFRIPIKVGFRGTGYITNGNCQPGDGVFIIKEEDV